MSFKLGLKSFSFAADHTVLLGREYRVLAELICSPTQRPSRSALLKAVCPTQRSRQFLQNSAKTICSPILPWELESEREGLPGVPVQT